MPIQPNTPDRDKPLSSHLSSHVNLARLNSDKNGEDASGGYVAVLKREVEEINALLANIYTTIPFGILRFLRCKGIYHLLSINSAALRMLGFTEENVFSNDWSSGIATSICSTDRKSIMSAYNKLSLVGDAQTIDHYCAHLPDGTTTYLSGEATLLSEDANGQLIQHTIYDITDRIMLEKQLNLERMQYRDALLHDCHLAYTFDVNEGIIHALQKATSTSTSTIQLPVHYDTLIRWLMDNHDTLILSGSWEENSTAGYLAAYEQGKRCLQLEYYAPSRGAFQRKTTFLSKDPDTDHVLACVLTQDVTEDRRKELVMQLALEDLAGAAKQVAQGNLDVTFDVQADGHVGQLAQVMQQMVNQLKERFEHVNQLAHTDALSMLRNKRAFDLAVDDLNSLLEKKNDVSFGVVMFDLNGLKQVNDTWGHEQGDQFIRTASSFIKSIFYEVFVYRIGGDEFVAILDSLVLHKVDKLITSLQMAMTEYNQAHPEIPYDISVAVGYSEYDSANDTCFADVLRRADMLMYEDKARQKAHRLEHKHK